MPISAPGSKKRRGPWGAGGATAGPASVLRSRGASGFTLIELLIVIAIVAVAAGVMSLALRDSAATRLEEEGARLSALLEMARAEARVAGASVRWVPTPDSADTGFVFVGMPRRTDSFGLAVLPTRWLDSDTRATIGNAPFVVLGPDAILPPQRVTLHLGAQSLELVSDGLSAFAVAAPAAATP